MDTNSLLAAELPYVVSEYTEKEGARGTFSVCNLISSEVTRKRKF